MSTQSVDIALPNKNARELNKWLEWSGCLLGITGATLLAMNFAYSGWGFVAFLLSNFCWIWFGVRTKTKGLVTMQIVFTATSILGISQWL